MANLMTNGACLADRGVRDSVEAPCRRFLGDESGASLPIVAAVLIPLMGFVGLGVDASRGYLIKARLGDALDAAVLASAQVIADDGNEGQHTGPLNAALANTFNANFPPGYMGATVELGTAVVDNDEETITVSAVATLDTTFMSLFGFESLQIGSETEVTMQTVAMDVVLSIDMSGSMGNSDGAGSTRIASARTAAKELVDILFGSDSTKDELLIGLVPWNDKVNISIADSTYNSWSLTTQAVPTFINPISGLSQSVVYYANNTPVPLLAEPAADWDGCVFARYDHNATNDDDADHLLGPVTTPNGTEWPAWMPSQVATGGGSDDDDDDDDDDGSGLWGGYASYPCLVRGVTPMTHERSVIDDEIDALTNPTGTTNIAQGLAWA